MMTMSPNSPEFAVNELEEVYAHGADDFWIINCSHIKPHTYSLDLIAEMWRRGGPEGGADHVREFVDRHLSTFIKRYYRSGLAAEIEDACRLWPSYCPSYGPYEDDHAGEQFANHGARMLACGFIRSYQREEPEQTGSLTELAWICPADSLREQVKFYEDHFEKAFAGYREYLDRCLSVRDQLRCAGDEAAARAFDDNLVCQVQYHYHSYLGGLHICRALRACLSGGGDPDRYLTAFYEAGLAAKAFLTGYETMRGHEHDVWKGFYANDCEADIRQSGYVAKSLMSYLRVLGNGPHFYSWQRRFQQEAGGDKVLLILRLKAHLTDDELWELIRADRNVNSEFDMERQKSIFRG